MRVNFVRTEINEHELEDFLALWGGGSRYDWRPRDGKAA